MPFVVEEPAGRFELGGKDPVHAAVGPHVTGATGNVVLDQLGELKFVVALLLQRRAGDVLRNFDMPGNGRSD